MEKACLLVEELLEKIHKEYKEYCEKNNIVIGDWAQSPIPIKFESQK